MTTTFGLGNVLGTGFRVWARNLLPFTLITALIYSPLLLWGVSLAQGELDAYRIERIVDFERYSGILAPVLNILVSAALTYGVVMELQGQRASLGACIAIGLRRFFPALGAVLLTTLCVGVVCFVIGLVVSQVSTTAAVIIVCIAALWLLSMFYVATQASVIERPGVMAALGRSHDLTHGHKFALSLLLVILALLGVGRQYLVQIATLPNIPLYVYVHLASEVVVGSIGAVMASVTYYLLRAEKEGTSAAELAAVFD